MNNYLIFCENCSFKKIVKSNDDLSGFVFVKLSQIQKTIPQIDPLTGQLKQKNINQPKKIKCPNCGFATKPKLIKEEPKNEHK